MLLQHTCTIFKINSKFCSRIMLLRVILVFNATFNNISVTCILWRSVLLMEETRVPRENHRSVASNWQTLSHNVVLSTPRLSGFELTTLVVIGTYCIGSCKRNYHTITTMMAPATELTVDHLVSYLNTTDPLLQGHLFYNEKMALSERMASLKRDKLA